MASLTRQLQLLLDMLMLMMLTPVLCASSGTPSVSLKHWQFDSNRLLYPDTTTSTIWPDYTSTTSTFMLAPDLTETVTSTDLILNTHDLCKVSATTVTAVVTASVTATVTPSTVTVREPVLVTTTVTYTGPTTTLRPTINLGTRTFPVTRTVIENPTAYVQMALPPPAIPPPEIPSPAIPPPSMVTTPPLDVFTQRPYTPWVPHIVGHSFSKPRSHDFETSDVTYPDFPMYTAINPVDPPVDNGEGRPYINMYDHTYKKRDLPTDYVPSLSADENLVIWNIAGPTPVLHKPVTTVVEHISSDITREWLLVLTTTTSSVVDTDHFTPAAAAATPTPGLAKKDPSYHPKRPNRWTTSNGQRVSGGSFRTEYPGTRPVAGAIKPTAVGGTVRVPSTFKKLYTRD